MKAESEQGKDPQLEAESHHYVLETTASATSQCRTG